MCVFKILGLKKKANKSSKIFDELFPGETFMNIEYRKPSEYVSRYWDEYKKCGNNDKSINGSVFELIIYTLLYREKILPIYLQANLAFIPNVKYDLILYNEEVGPVSLSLKTSLRERKKQADLEAVALKYVHRKAKCYLISIDAAEVVVAQNDIKKGALLGLDYVLNARDPEFDEFIKRLKEVPFTTAGSVPVISSNSIIKIN